jgi:hypothetical protein
LASAIFGKGRSGGGIDLRKRVCLTRGPGVSVTTERGKQPRWDAEGKKNGPRAWETGGPRVSGGLPVELG